MIELLNVGDYLAIRYCPQVQVQIGPLSGCRGPGVQVGGGLSD